MKTELVKIDDVKFHVDLSFLIDDTLYFNATEMAKAFKKRPNDWLNLGQAKKYIRVLTTKISGSENLIITVNGGKNKGTWLHKKLSLPFARWLSVEFEIALDEWIEAKLKEEHKRKFGIPLQYELPCFPVPENQTRLRVWQQKNAAATASMTRISDDYCLNHGAQWINNQLVNMGVLIECKAQGNNYKVITEDYYHLGYNAKFMKGTNPKWYCHKSEEIVKIILN